VAVAVWPAHNTQGGITGDFWRIWTNALNWAAAGSTPATIAPSAFDRPVVRMRTTPADESVMRRGGSDEMKTKLPLR
jgi:hypothetical protein